MKIKTTMKCPLTLVRMAVINKSTSAGEDVKKGEPFSIAGGNADWCIHFENTMEIAQKIKNESAFWPSNPTSENISEGTQITNLKEHKHPYVYCNVIYSCQDMEAA